MRWILLLALATVIMANEESELNRLSLSVDDEGSPAFAVPIHWNEHYFSGVSYSSTQTKSHESLETSQAKAQLVTGTDIVMAGANILTYQDSIKESSLIYAIGANVGYAKFDFDQVGYAYQDSSNYFAAYSTGTAKLYQFGLYADLSQTKLLDFFSYRIGLLFYPLTYMNYTETATTVPTPTYDYTVNTQKMQSPLQFDLFATTLFEVSRYLDIMLVGAYHHNHLKRTFIDYEAGRLDYIQVDYDFDTTQMAGSIKLLFPIFGYGGISPSIGMTRTKNTQKNSFSSGNSYTSTVLETAYMVGFDKPF